MKSIYQIVLFVVMGVIFIPSTYAQQKTYTLGTAQTNVPNVYVARDYVHLTEGYSFSSANGIMEAKINENLLFNADYLTGSNIPDVSTYDRDPKLKFGSTNGALNVTQTGAATYSIPINCPLGVGNMAPQVTIAYSSQSGNGTVGWGYNIAGASSISRVPKTVYNDMQASGLSLTKNDRFAMDGNRLLAPFGADYGGDNVDYYTEKESFSKITSYGNYGGNGPDYFIVTTKNGTIMKFGSSTGKLEYTSTSKNAVVAWYLDYVEDINGNTMTYTYENDGLSKVLKTITYGTNKNVATNLVNTVEFFYEKRSDIIHLQIDEQRSISEKILNRIVTKSNNMILRSYNFEYATDVYSRLVKVTESNGKGEKMNPTVFSWTMVNKTPSLLTTNIQVANHPMGYTVHDQRWISGDLNGDGLTDLISFIDRTIDGVQCTVIQYYYASLQGESIIFSAGPSYNGELLNYDFYEYAWFNTNILLRLGGMFNMGDFNGDNIQELCVARYVMDNQGSKINFTVYNNGTSIEKSIQTNNPPLHIGTRTEFDQKNEKVGSEKVDQIPYFSVNDFNNDGYADILYLERLPDNNKIYGRLHKSVPVIPLLPNSSIDEESFIRTFQNIDFYFENIAEIRSMFVNDFNKDGLPDLILITINGMEFFQNTGYPNAPFNSTPTHSNTTILCPYVSIPILPGISLPSLFRNCIREGDFNGDGLIDFIFNKSLTAEWKIAYNNGDFTFTMVELPDITAFNDFNTVHDDSRDDCIVTDINNDGKSDLILFDAEYYWEHVDDKTFKKYTTYWYLSNGYDFDKYKEVVSKDFMHAPSQYRMYGDFNGDGRFDMINYGNDCITEIDPDVTPSTTAWHIYSTPNINNSEGLITSIADGIGLKKYITYAPITLGASANYSIDPAGNPENLNRVLGPITVVKSVDETNGIVNNSTTTYTYSDALAHHYLGFVGFGKTTIHNSLSNQKIENTFRFKHELLPKGNEYDHTEYAIAPVIKNQTQYVGSNIIINTVTDYSAMRYQTTGVQLPLLPLYRDKPYFLYGKTTTITDNIEKNIVVTESVYGNENVLIPEGNITGKTTTIKKLDTENTILATQTESYINYQDRTPNDGFSIKNAPDSVVTTASRVNETNFVSKTSFEYNTKCQVTKKTDFANKTKPIYTTYQYNDIGNPTNTEVSSSGLVSRTSQVTYDPTLRFAETQTNAIGHSSKTRYDLWGNKLVEWDANNLSTYYTYDSWGGLTETLSPEKNKQISSIMWVTTETEAPANAKYYTEQYIDNEIDPDLPIRVGAEYFDRAGHSLRKVGYTEDGIKMYSYVSYYKTTGQIKEETQPYPAEDNDASLKTIYTYDPRNRIATQKSPTGITTTYDYFDSESSKKVGQTLSTGESYTKKYDAAGLLEEATDPGGTIKYYYTSTGKTKSVVAPGSTTSIEYDEYDNQSKLIDPNAGTYTYEYNAYGELVKQTDAEGKITEMVYDVLGRVSSSNSLSDNITINYRYDPDNAKGQVETISSTGKIPVKYEYDNLGRVKKEIRNPGTNQLMFQYEYNEWGRLNKLTYPEGLILTYQYNDYGKKDQINWQKGTTTKLLWRSKTYSLKGLLIEAEYGNGKTVNYGYDAYDRMNSITVPGIVDFKYTFNDKNQLENRTENGVSETFEYDLSNRLTKVNNGEHTDLEMKYTDGVSTQNDRIVNKSDIGNYVYKSTTNHQLNYVELLKGQYLPKHELTYTPELKTATLKETTADNTVKLATFVYGVDDQRYSMTYKINDVLQYTRYYFNEYEKETNADGSLKRHLNYVYAPTGLVAVFEQTASAEKMHYIYTDYKGSLKCITNESGTVEQYLSYDAWGKRRNAGTGAPFLTTPTDLMFARGYTGHEHLDEFGLINMKGRIYDPTLAVFLSPDQYVQAPDFTQNFNRYAYCLNNPLMYSDPDGNWAIVDDIAAMLIGGTINWVMNGCQFTGEGLGYFATGVAAGEATLYGGPLAGGAVMGLGNNLTAQISMNGLKNIDFGSAVFSTALGVGTAYLGGQINQALAPYMSKWLSGVSDRIAYNALSQGLSNSISGFGIGTTFSLLNGDDFGTALYNGGKGAVTGFGLGVISGTVESIKIQRQIKDDNLKAPLKTLEAKNSQVTSNQSTTNSGEIIYYRGGNSFNMSKADLTSSVDKTTGLMNGRRGVSLNSDKMNPNVQKYGGAWEVDMKTFPSDLKIKPTTNTHFEIVPRNQGMTLSTYQDLLKTIKLEPYNKR